jgi:hypothetical protein
MTKEQRIENCAATGCPVCLDRDFMKTQNQASPAAPIADNTVSASVPIEIGTEVDFIRENVRYRGGEACAPYFVQILREV